MSQAVDTHRKQSGLRAELVRRANRRLVFTSICEAPVTRSQLAARLGLSTTAVAHLTAELLTLGLVAETGVGNSVGGRWPRLLEATSSRRRVLGLEVRRGAVRAVLADPGGRVLGDHQAECGVESAPAAVLDAAIRCGRELTSRLSSGESLLAVGAAFAAPVDVHGRVRPPDMPGWDNDDIDVGNHLSEAFGVEVVVDNDANLGAVAELRYGAGRGCRNLVYILVHRGVGAGIIVDGQLYRGENNRAGEIGHTVVDPEGERCDCGSFGCLETAVSTRALVRYWQEGIRIGRPTEVPESASDLASAIVEAAAGGDRAASEAVRHLSEVLGLALANVAMLFSPELVMIGGPVTRAGDILLEPAQAIAATRSRRLVGDATRFSLGSLGESGPCLGGVALAVDRFLERPVGAEPVAV